MEKYDPGIPPLEYRARGFSQEVVFEVSILPVVDQFTVRNFLLLSPSFTFSTKYHLDTELAKRLIKFDSIQNPAAIIYRAQQYLRAYQQAYPGDVLTRESDPPASGRQRYQPLPL
jgi:hypothetical protein